MVYWIWNQYDRYNDVFPINYFLVFPTITISIFVHDFCALCMWCFSNQVSYIINQKSFLLLVAITRLYANWCALPSYTWWYLTLSCVVSCLFINSVCNKNKSLLFEASWIDAKTREAATVTSETASSITATTSVT